MRTPRVAKRLDDVYARMKSETLEGRQLGDVVGGGDPKLVGEMNRDVLLRNRLLTSRSRVFEIGCGCGRLAAALVPYLSLQGCYVGIDILPGLIEFCRREISPLRPNFEFHAVRETNPFYERFRANAQDAAWTDEPSSWNGAFDLVVAFSVFTHLEPEESLVMLRRVWERLAYGGAAVLSFFILDPASRANIRRGLACHFTSTENIDGRVVQQSPESPNSVVGHDHDALREMILAAGFEGIDTIHYGGWHRPGAFHYQDIVVLRKDEPLPAGFDPEEYLQLNPDVRAGGMNPALHFRFWGRKEGRRWSGRE